MKSDRDEAGTEDSEPHLDVPTDRPVLLFDGVCNLCTESVQWIIERDPEGEFRFASLQSDAGRALLSEFGLPGDYVDSIVLVEGGEYYTRSTAALRVAKRLGLPYAALYPLIAVPSAVRDRVYDVVANNRYEVFGRKASCMVPSPEIEDRFLD